MIGALLDLLRRLLWNAGRPLRLLARRSLVPPGSGRWLRVRWSGPLEEIAPPRLPFAQPTLGLLEWLQTLRAAGEDPRLDGVLVQLDGAASGVAQALALRRGLAQLRARGKRVVVYAAQLDASDLLVASAADQIMLPETGQLPLVGLRADSFFLKDLFQKVGVEADVVRIGRSKTAGEMFTRSAMSDAQREQVDALLDDTYDAFVSAVAEGRDLDPEAVRALVDGGPYTAARACELGLIDACHYPDELPELLEKLTPTPEAPATRRVAFVDGLSYAALAGADAGWVPLFGELPRLAYVVLAGSIHRGRGLRGIASETTGALLRELREDPAVRGVVLRIDSPGGDALASDLLWREVERMRRDKPVVVSMGNVAASGGYYIAAAADEVLAESGSVTGSIGVVGGKINLGRLYERLGIGRDGVERGARAGMFSDVRGFRPDERRAVREGMEAMYGAFLDRVARGRNLALADVERVAQGRVWSGARARRHGLVDALGGPLEALRAARRRAGFREGERLWLDVHPRVPRLASLRSLLGGR